MAYAATCTIGSGVSVIGSEAFATYAYNDGSYLYAITALRCTSGSVVSWLNTDLIARPDDVVAAIRGQQLNMSRIFRNQCGSMIYVAHDNFRGTLNDGTGPVSMLSSAYPLGQTYYDVFSKGLSPGRGDPLGCDCPGGLARLGSAQCVPPPPRNPPKSCPAVGNPILPGLGCKVERETDYALGDGPLRFVRYYDSGSPYHRGAGARRALGNRWRHNHDVMINPAAAPNRALMLRDGGQILYFDAPAGVVGMWSGAPDSTGSLERTASGWIWRDGSNAVEHFDLAGRRLSRTGPDGLSLHYTYPVGSYQPTRIEDDFGRALTLAYNGRGLLTRLTLPTGQYIDYAYDGTDNLTRVTHADLSSRQYTYTSRTVGTRSEPALLTGVIDEAGVTYAAWDYDAQALAISSSHSGGAGLTSVTYQHDAAGHITAASVTRALGAVVEYTFTRVHDTDLLASQSLPIPGGAVQTRSYDANGNLARRVDFDGSLTTYTHDPARNLEITRTEGLTASGAVQEETRTISTAWHPDWRLRSAQAAPGRITRWLYNGQIDPGTGQPAACTPPQALVTASEPLPVLCARTEQATNDADGSAGFAAQVEGNPRTWRYTYDVLGRLLSEDGPRTDVADVTTYTYWEADATCPGASEGTGMDKGCRGQLKQVTNAAGHVTAYLKYNAHGQLLHRRDPNGLDHHYTYDARQRVSSRSVGGLITRYQYDARGLLTRVTAPDGSTLDYTYDAARRLTRVADALGNHIDYTLDAAGNRTAEAIKDANGVLRQAIAREYDVLSRLRTETLGVAP